MNKQELIEKIKANGEWFETNRYVKITKVIELVNQIDEPQKVKVPAFVAEWIIQHCAMGKYVCLERFICQYNSVELPTELYNYYDNNKDDARDKVISAILDGYEVEEEQKYYIQLPETTWGTYLVKGEDNELFVWQNATCGTRFTEDEIKSIDERYWAFAVPVEKV